MLCMESEDIIGFLSPWKEFTAKKEAMREPRHEARYWKRPSMKGGIKGISTRGRRETCYFSASK